MKNQTKPYGGKINTYFHNDNIPKSQRICLLATLIGSVFRAGKNYCSQVFSEEYKHVVKQNILSILLTI